MVHQDQLPSNAMGQVGLCALTAPLTDSPLNSGFDFIQQEPQTNGAPSDIMTALSTLLANKSDIKSEDLLLKLQYVINENFELKDTITQNNLALRQQMNLLVQWHQQVEQQQRIFRQELNDANNIATSLQQENSLLKSTLASFKNTNSSTPKFQELDNTIQKLNQELELRDRKLQTLMEEKESLLSHRTQLEGEVTLMKCDLTATKREFECFNLQRQELLSTVKELRATSLNRHETLAGQIGSSEVLQKKRHQDLGEKDANTTLLQELQTTQNQVEYLESELKISREETARYKQKLQMSSTELQSPRLSPSSIDNRMIGNPDARDPRDQTAMLREEVKALEGALAEERKRTGEERSTLNRLQGETLRLKKELADSRDQSDRRHYNDQYYQTKIKSIQEMSDESTAKVISYEELLGAKNDEIARLKKDLGQTKAQLTEIQSEGETMAVLRAQVEVYQSDFRAEREAREAMASDREKLREDLRHLQMRNTQLMDELESYQRRHFNQAQGRSSRSGSEEPKELRDNPPPPSLNPEFNWEKLSNSSDKKEEEVEEVDENLLYCPKCNKTFTELRPLEEHVNRCLDED